MGARPIWQPLQPSGPERPAECPEWGAVSRSATSPAGSLRNPRLSLRQPHKVHRRRQMAAEVGPMFAQVPRRHRLLEAQWIDTTFSLRVFSPQRNGRRLPKAVLIIHGEPTELPEPALRCDVSDRGHVMVRPR